MSRECTMRNVWNVAGQGTSLATRVQHTDCTTTSHTIPSFAAWLACVAASAMI